MRPKDPNIDKALKYLSEKVDRPMTLEEIANVCGCRKQTIHQIYYSAMAKICKNDLDDIKEIWDDLKHDEH